MKSFQVNLGDRSYSIDIKSGLIKEDSLLLAKYNHGQKWIIITQHNLMELFGYNFLKKLENNGFDVDFITIPNGEAAKSINEYSRIISQMIQYGCDRKTSIICLGGGVVGDVGGFVASSFMRGVDYFQIPTTLLAMVDSSIGGKTGINVSEGKNLVGAIYQPKRVIVDPNLLESLPKEEVNAGIGEIIKYGAIWNKEFLLQIRSWLMDINNFPFDNAIYTSCKIKAEIVSKDENEHGIRKILNFGHTIGHALESYLGYGKIRHGEAVAFGMKSSGYISGKLGSISKNDLLILINMIDNLPLPELPHINPNHLLPFIKNDKKTEKGKLNFVILDNLGNAKTTTKVDEDLIIESLKVLN
ncbi:MAG: 3-dehydroquinate synthase [Fidelibacterota bacterium]|jgi:3-dehydroquinate synthase|nr:3-dehydroquinate synthase [Candidatus Neomarinimicrobiota bacterium]|tara:strand:+ start:1905 stop:2975 length:1071 start_codon:yes stop_codon:yes gene_type:complete